MIRTFKHFPYTKNFSKVEIDTIEAFGTPGEEISLSFSTTSDIELYLEFIPEPLSSTNGNITTDMIGTYVVKEWDQAGIGVYQSEKTKLPELLIKDDRQKLHDSYGRVFRNWRNFLRPKYRYRPPNIRLQGNAITVIHPGEQKQIWISISIPASANSGTYNGEIFIVNNKNEKIKSVKVKVEILNFKLLEAKQQLFLWYKGSLDWWNTQHYVSENIFVKQLEDIYRHGFRSISIHETREKYAQKAICIAESLGFTKFLLFTPPFPENFSNLKFQKATPIFYLSDEIDAHINNPNDTSIQRHKANSIKAKCGNVKTMASLMKENFSRRLANELDIGHPPDIFSYYLPLNLEYFACHSEFQDFINKEIFYYWTTHMEKPSVHRVLSGFYLWKTKATGISPYCYQHLPQYPNSPFNDFDQFEPNFHVGDERRPFKDHMTTYPSKNGSIPTIQWKGLAEGITDLRYINTLECELENARQSQSKDLIETTKRVEKRLKDLFSKISLRNISIISETEREPYPDVSPEQFYDFRKQIAEDIILLKSKA